MVGNIFDPERLVATLNAQMRFGDLVWEEQKRDFTDEKKHYFAFEHNRAKLPSFRAGYVRTRPVDIDDDAWGEELKLKLFYEMILHTGKIPGFTLTASADVYGGVIPGPIVRSDRRLLRRVDLSNALPTPWLLQPGAESLHVYLR